MLFSSITFLFYFLPAMALIYLAVPRKWKNGALFLGSLFFYWWGEQRLVLVLLITIAAGYLSGRLLEKYTETKIGRILLVLSCIWNIGMLAYFKYVNFFIDTWNQMLPWKLPVLSIALPLGISFYTFQILSYEVDVYQRKVPAQRNFIYFGAYVCLFPQLIAGPIVRYADVAKQLENRTHTVNKTAEGIRRFIIGLGKKVLLADTFGELCAKATATTDASVLFLWLGAISFMLEIYYDFSGYSDMAIGLGRMFGFVFPENFSHPYASRSITEFWRRWHISLGTWFRDYVYIPLGGNRKGRLRQFWNILIVWGLTGLWHGASWNFVLWGLFFAVLLLIEKAGLLNWLQKHPILAHGYVILAVLFGFVLFDTENLALLGQKLLGMLGGGGLPAISKEAVYALKSYGVTLGMGIVGASGIAAKAGHRIMEKRFGNCLEIMWLLGIFLAVVSYLVSGSFQTFLYFRF